MTEASQKTEQRSSYRGIFKTTSLFGGLQVYQIIIGIIRSKFIAVILGPEGMGISGLFQSGLDLVKSATSLGVSRSAVRDVAEANGTGDKEKINRIVTVLRKLVWCTGLLGMIAVILFSPLLSQTSFGSYGYIISFIILSVILLFNQLSAGQSAILQGLRKYKYLAKSSAIGATIGLFVTIPLYYWLGTDGIVPALVINAIVTFLLTWYFSHKIPIDKVQITTRETLKEGREMMSLGIIMCLNGFMVSGCSYALRAFIGHAGGLEQVGLFNAGFAIVNTYVGMVFTAMTTDYYPRLAAINKDNDKCKEVINQQAEIAILILSPILLFGIVFTPIILQLFYSDKFVPSNEYVRWALAGTLFKAISWSISYIFVSKGDKYIFIKNEIISNILTLIIGIVGYKFLGLTGLGIGFFLNYFIYAIIVYIVAKRKYNFELSSSIVLILLQQLILIGICIVSIYYLNGWLMYGVTITIIIISIILTFKGLNDKMGIVQYFKNRRNGKK